jgi:AbrB family looped-hinge helix DNA binding protein
MNTTVTLDKAGRVVIPKTLRDELRLAPGDTLTLEFDGDGAMLRPVRSASALRKEHGIWVFRSGRKLTAAETEGELGGLRQKRDRELREHHEPSFSLEDAAAIATSGGTTYDAIVAQCALKAKAQTIYTWNVKHFNRLGEHVAARVRHP